MSDNNNTDTGQDTPPVIDLGLEARLEEIASDPATSAEISQAAQTMLADLQHLPVEKRDMLERLSPEKLSALLASIASIKAERDAIVSVKADEKPFVQAIPPPPMPAPVEPVVVPAVDPLPKPKSVTKKPAQPKSDLCGYAAASALMATHNKAVYLCLVINTGMLDTNAAKAIGNMPQDDLANLLDELPDTASEMRRALNEKFPTVIPEIPDFQEF